MRAASRTTLQELRECRRCNTTFTFRTRTVQRSSHANVISSHQNQSNRKSSGASWGFLFIFYGIVGLRHLRVKGTHHIASWRKMSGPIPTTTNTLCGTTETQRIRPHDLGKMPSRARKSRTACKGARDFADLPEGMFHEFCIYVMRNRRKI